MTRAIEIFPLEQSNPKEGVVDFSNVVMILDVDQVLADMMIGHLNGYNQELALGMSQDEIVDYAHTYRKTFDVPPIKDFRAQHKELFDAARNRIRTDVQLHSEFPALENSIQGAMLMQNLIETHQGKFGGYFTARPPEIGASTPAWLEKHGFPAGEVVVSNDSKHKLLTIIEAFQLTDTPVTSILLIDDSIDSLVDSANKLLEEHPEYHEVLSRITVAAFSYETHEIQSFIGASPLTVVPFPGWNIDYLQQLNTQ